MKELIGTLLLMASSAYLSYYFTSGIYFKKGLMSARDKYSKILHGEAEGAGAMENNKSGHHSKFFGERALNLPADSMTGNTTLGATALCPNENIGFGFHHIEGVRDANENPATMISCPDCKVHIFVKRGVPAACYCGWRQTKGNFPANTMGTVVGCIAGTQDADGKSYPPFQLQKVINKRVRFKNGNEYVIAGGEENSLLLKCDNGNTCGFGRLEDIKDIIG